MAAILAVAATDNWNNNGSWVGGVCNICDKRFTTSNPRKIFCSRQCAIKAANGRRPRIGTYLSKCGVCEKEYENNAYQSKYCSRPCKSRASDFRKRLKARGLIADEYTALLEKQDYKCGICKSERWGDKNIPRIDHDHDTGRVRGLLCNNCNLGIGMLGDSYETIRAALEWLRR